MKRLALRVRKLGVSYLLVSLQLVAPIVLILGTLASVYAAEFSCSSDDVTCLIARIKDANLLPGTHIINLAPGTYTLQIVDNVTDGANGLPSITRPIRVQASMDDPPTVIQRDPGAQGFRIFHVSVVGELSLEGVTVQRGGGLGFSGSGGAILNRGVTTLRDSIVTDSSAMDEGAISNRGTLNVFRSIIADNGTTFVGGGIFNDLGGNVLVENSTIAHNGSQGGGGIWNEGSIAIRNSAIIFNATGGEEAGGGILNSGIVEIVNSTIAKNIAGGATGGGGGGVYNCCGGLVSITNSTIRENQIGDCGLGFCRAGGGIHNDGGTLRVQNTIVAGNAVHTFFSGGAPDCFGTITSLGNNLVGDPSDCAINLQPSDLMGDPGLGSLVGTGEDDLPGGAYYPVLAGSAVIDSGNPNACLQTDQLGNFRVGICDIGSVEFRGPALVSVDVRPKKDANRINPNSTKVINVAIFSVNGFDATSVDPNTVRFGATGMEAAPVHVAQRDVNGNGHRDMVLRFQIQSTGIKCGDTSASLTGQTSNGVSFIGSSPIKTVQCKK